MELRYIGFDQAQNRRVYKFDCKAEDKSTMRFAVSVDMVLFLRHHSAGTAVRNIHFPGALERQVRFTRFRQKSSEADEARAGVARAGVDVAAGGRHRAVAQRGL